MTLVDLVILAIVALGALQGYIRGFLVGAAGLIGFAGGAYIGTRIGPHILSGGSSSPYAPLFGLGGAVIVGGLLASFFGRIARNARRLLWIPGLRLLDGLLGAVLTAAIGLGLVWILGAALLQTATEFQLPASMTSSIRRSAILRDLNRTLPPSGRILDAMGRIDPLPSVDGRVAAVPAPDQGIMAARGVRAAGASVVRIVGVACGLGVEGSGWVAAPGLVVTNAHVVAGDSTPSVQVGGSGSELPARAVVFDPHNDIAVLSVPALRLSPLELASEPQSGEAGAILGYPQNGPYNVQPGRLGETAATAAQDAYGNAVMRQISSLRGLVRPGNSGGPLVDAAGQVIGTVFAEITNAPAGEPGGFAVPDSVVAGEIAAAHAAHGPVSTQGCAD